MKIRRRCVQITDVGTYEGVPDFYSEKYVFFKMYFFVKKLWHGLLRRLRFFYLCLNLLQIFFYGLLLKITSHLNPCRRYASDICTKVVNFSYSI